MLYKYLVKVRFQILKIINTFPKVFLVIFFSFLKESEWCHYYYVLYIHCFHWFDMIFHTNIDVLMMVHKIISVEGVNEIPFISICSVFSNSEKSGLISKISSESK